MNLNDHSEELDRMQLALDSAKLTPKDDPLKEVLRLAALTGGANATLGLEDQGVLPTPDLMQQLEDARATAHQEQVQKEAEQARLLGSTTVYLA